MGVGINAITLLHALKKQGHLSAKPRAIMEIGRQQLANSFLNGIAEMKAVGAEFGVAGLPPLPSALPTHIVHGNLEHLNPKAPDSKPFWEWLGYRYATIDVDGSDAIALDLNYDPVPESHRGQFDLVTNFGTTEHIANQLHAFKVIHELTAHHGVMIHDLPAMGMVNHGLVNYNVKFFWMLARSNGYQVLHLNYRPETAHPYPLPDNIVDYCTTFEPQYRQQVGPYQVVDGMIFVALKKVFDIPYVPPLDVPTGDKPINRAMEERYWTLYRPDAFTAPPAKAERKSLLERIKQLVGLRKSA